MSSSPSPATTAAAPSGNTSSSSSIPPENPNKTKRKRRPAGTPDPDAEVVSLSPWTLLESDLHVCEICNQGFRREQNLQMHRRRHKVPWRLLKRKGSSPRKRVFVCPEASCLHHEARHALGDLVGIKKHFRRKHSERRQWACVRCCKAYAVHSDYKAHLKTCGTRGHSCDCGRVFSRVESFIEHQDSCNAGRDHAHPETPQAGHGSWTASSPSPTSNTKTSTAAAVTWPGLRMPNPNTEDQTSTRSDDPCPHNLELQLLPTSQTIQLQLSNGNADEAVADETRRQAKMDVELAEQELANAKRIRQQAQAELNKAYVLRGDVAKRIDSILLHITCHDCQQQQQAKKTVEPLVQTKAAAGEG